MDKLGKLLPQVLRRRGLTGRVAEARARVVFAEVVGADLAASCETVELVGATLTVTTSSPALAHQLRLDSEALMSRMNERELGRRVRAIRVRTGRGPAPQRPR